MELDIPVEAWVERFLERRPGIEAVSLGYRAAPVPIRCTISSIATPRIVL